VKHDQLVRVTPGFKASINLITDMGDSAKIAGYIPTQFAGKLLDEVAQGLATDGTQRSFLVHGAYGTGKSHLALTVAAYLGAAWDQGFLAPVLDKLRGLDPTLAERLVNARSSIVSPLLLVPVYGSEAPTRETLLTSLDEALLREGLQHVMPQTAFHAAIERIQVFHKQFPESIGDMVRAFQKYGYATTDAIIRDLKRFSRDALQAFDDAHPLFSRGARADHALAQRPEEVYKAVSQALQQSTGIQRRSGILIIWDEFGLHLERVLDDPKQSAYLDLQNFAESCTGSKSDRLFFLGLAHRSIEQTISLMSGLAPSQRDVLVRIAGRFEQRRMAAQPGEQFYLLSRVLLAVDPTQTESFWSDWRSWSGALTQRIIDSKIFNNMSYSVIEKVVIQGIFPVHPTASFLLPVISEKVAQNDRTLFHFMGDSGPDGLPSFLAKESVEHDGRPNLLTSDRLFPYFAPIIASSRHEEVRTVWTRFRKLAPQSDPLIQRVLNVMLLLWVANRLELRPSAVGIALALGMHEADEVNTIGRLLEQMQREKLVRRTPIGEFEFRNLDGEVDLLESLEVAIGDVLVDIDMSPFWELWAPKVNLGADINARQHNKRFALNRTYAGDITAVASLKASRYKEQGAVRDGIAYWIIPLAESELEEAHKAAQAFTNPRVLVILPQQTPLLLPLIRKFQALNSLPRRLPQAFGPAGIQRDEWAAELLQVELDISDRLRQAYNHPVVYLMGSLYRCRTIADVEDLASQGMNDTYSGSLRIPHDKLLETSGNDGQKSSRTAVVQALLDSPLDQVANLPLKPVAFIVDAVLKETGWLRLERDKWVLGRPNESAYPNSAAVWDKIDNYVTSHRKQYVSLRLLMDDLTSPPFGLRPRTIPLLLAAGLREHKASLSFATLGKTIDLSSDLVEKMVKEPGGVYLVYAALSYEQRWVLEQIMDTLAIGELSENAPLKQTEKHIVRLLSKLPNLAQHSAKVSDTTRLIRDQVLRPIAEGAGTDFDERSLRRCLFEILPALCGLSTLKDAKLTTIKITVGSAFAEAVRELHSVFDKQVLPMLAEVFQAPSPGQADIRQAANDFITNVSSKPRQLFSASQTAFIDATRHLASDPHKHMDDFAAALGQRSWLQWNDEDLLTVKVKASLIREQIEQIHMPIESEIVVEPPVDTTSPTSLPQPLKPPTTFPPAKPPEAPKVPVAPTPPRPQVVVPTTVKLHVSIGTEAYDVTTGGMLPPELKYALAGVETALQGFRLSRKDRLQVVSEALVQVFKSK
jgi:hypothetical protein